MSAADRALEAIDAGLQRSSELGLPLEPSGYCWRCTVRALAEGSDLCAPCRAYLLEEVDVDPRGALTAEELAALTEFVTALVAAVRPILEAIVEALVPVAERLLSLFERPARADLARRTLVEPGAITTPGEARPFPTLPIRDLPLRDLRTTEAPRTAPTPRRRIRP